MSKIFPFKKEYHCPKCGVTLTLGNTFNCFKGYMCIQCARKLKVRTYQKLEEKDLTCKICSKKLTLGNIAITPTTIICSDCDELFRNSQYYLQHAKSTVQFGKYKATMTLLFLIIIVYAITSFPSFTTTSDYFIQLAALTPATIQHHEFWRFITANFMHANTQHLFANSVSIAIWGHLLEKNIQSKAVFILIGLSALMTTSFSDFFSPYTISLGASGIAYGLMTSFIIYLIVVTILKNPSQVKSQLISFFALVLFQLAYNLYESSTVDIWGHLGGTIAGVLFIVFYFLFSTRKKLQLHL